MGTKSFFARMLDALDDHPFWGQMVILLIVNPISMFVYNLFNPEGAARFVQNNLNDFWRNFYTRCALKWPLGWSKYWITLDNLETCRVQLQVDYYCNIDGSQAVLEAMSKRAKVELVHEYSDLIEQITKQMRLTDDMFNEWLEQVIQYDSYETADIEKARASHPFSNYLKQGKLPFSQVMLLTKAAVEERNRNAYEGLMKDLYDYIERFGLSKEQLNEIAQYMCDNLYWRDPFAEEPITNLAKELAQRDKFWHFYNILEECQINYEQRVFTKSQRGSKQTDEWRKFCESTKYICVAAQKEMDIDQYHVFHATGHWLDVDAIAYFLLYPDRTLHRMVFKYEPIEVFLKEELQQFLNANLCYLKAEAETEAMFNTLDCKAEDTDSQDCYCNCDDNGQKGQDEWDDDMEVMCR